MFRKVLCIFTALLMAVSLCACKKEYKSFDIDRDGGLLGQELEDSIAEGVNMTVLTKGSRLWKKFVKCAPSLPLETDEDIIEYAWEIRDILADRLYIRETEHPVCAEVGSDQVMLILYSAQEWDAREWRIGELITMQYDGDDVYVYVSMETGAVLAIHRWGT